MTNENAPDTNHRSLAIRWIAATSIVTAVGFGGFILRGEGSQRRESSPPVATTRRPAHQSSSFPDVSEVPSIDTGMGLSDETPVADDEPTLTDFTVCDSPPQPVPAAAQRAGWAHYTAPSDYGYSVEFDHPRRWNVTVEDGQIAAVSPDGERAFIVQVVPFDKPNVPLADLFSTMQNMHPERDYKDPRPVVVYGKPGCVATASGDGHSGEIGLLRGDGFMVVITAGHELDPAASALSEAWALIGSVQVGA